jgi:hypothetical protein
MMAMEASGAGATGGGFFRELAPGLFRVVYERSADLEPARQAPLIEAVRQASRTTAVGIVFVIGEDVVSVDFAVPSFWIRVTSDPAVRIASMAMVTGSMAVGIAARSFGAANRFRRVPLIVKAFTDEPQAVAWADSARAAIGPAAS